LQALLTAFINAMAAQQQGRLRQHHHHPVSADTPRMRMFAGPNGPGKSRLKSVLPPPLLGVFIGPDDSEQEIRRDGFLDFSRYQVSTSAAEVVPFFTGSEFLKSAGLAAAAERLTFAGNRLDFAGVAVDSYFASVAADLIRQKLLAQHVTFTFESVMSHRSKVDLFRRTVSPAV